MRSAIHFLGGSITVYLLMAACSAGNRANSHDGDHVATMGGAANQGGAMVAAGGVDNVAIPTAGRTIGIGGIVGEVMDPVPDAGAQDPVVGTADAPCDQKMVSGAFTYFYAEHSFPGRSIEELASVVALGHQVIPEWPALGLPPGYEWRALQAMVKPGAVAVVCSATSDGKNPGVYDVVRFIGP